MVIVEAYFPYWNFRSVCCFKKQSPYPFTVNLIVKNVVAVFYLKLAVLPTFSYRRAVSNRVFFSHFQAPHRKLFIVPAQLPLCLIVCGQCVILTPAFLFFNFYAEKACACLSH